MISLVQVRSLMPTTYKHLSPLSPLRYVVGLGWRGYKFYGELRKIMPPKALDHIDELGDRIRNRLETIGLSGSTHTRRSEAVLEIMYQELQRFENITSFESKSEQIYAQILRNSIVDWELILLPERHEVFNLFGVERQDTFSTIKIRYRQLARMLHPDKPHGDVERMSDINNAYGLLRRMLGET